jgi:hypothetical protein
MNKKSSFCLLILVIAAFGCATFHSIVKSTFPYSTDFVIARSTPVKTEQSVTGTGTSFDQSISKDGNAGARVKEVRAISATLKSKDPSDFNIGNLLYAKVYLSKIDGTGEILVASRTDITPGVGNSLVMDVDNSVYLDSLIKEPKVKMRMAYQLRNHIDFTTTLHLSVSVSANPGN